MAATVTLNGQKTFTLLNEPDLDFSFDQFSPNPSFVSAFVMQFVCTPSQDPIKWFEDYINENSIAVSPIAVLNTQSIGITGEAKLSSSQNTFYRNQGRQSQFNILFEPNTNNFFEKSKSLPLTKFIGAPRTATNEVPIIRYVTERNSPIEDFLFLVMVAQFSIEAARLIYNTADAIKEAVSSGFDTLSAILKTVLKVAMNLIYLTAVILALNELLKQATEIIFDKPKQLYALDVWNVIKKGCEYLGYNFESTLQDTYKNLTYLTSTTTAGVVTGNPRNQPIPAQSLLDFIERIGLMFRAKLKVANGVVIMENEDYFEQNPTDVKLSSLYDNGGETFDFENLPQWINLEYQRVQGDNNYKDNRYAVEFALKSGNKNKFNIENQINIQFPYSIGQPKTEQNFAEKTFNSLFDVLKGLSKSYKISNGDRINYLKLQQDIVQSDTIFIRSGQKIATESNELLKTETLYNQFYDNASPLNAQFVTVTDRGTEKICSSDTDKLINNNIALDNKGRTIIVTKNIKSAEDGTIDIEYKRRLYPGDFGYVGESVIKKDVKINIGN